MLFNVNFFVDAGQFVKSEERVDAARLSFLGFNDADIAALVAGDVSEIDFEDAPDHDHVLLGAAPLRLIAEVAPPKLPERGDRVVVARGRKVARGTEGVVV